MKLFKSVSLGALALVQFSSVLAAQNLTEKKTLRHIGPGPVRDTVVHSDNTADSSNWSGYVAYGTAFTTVAGSWVVPSIVCSGSAETEYAAAWVGLDGWGSATVEQTGTMSQCQDGAPTYWAWFESFPSEMYYIPVVEVAPGNVISASVVYQGGQFALTLTNETTGKAYTTNVTAPQADRATAEWIMEAPCCTSDGGMFALANFGTANLGEDYASVRGIGTGYAVDSTRSGPIGSFGSTLVQLTKIGSATSPQTSTCSGLSRDGTSFSCSWASGN